VGFNNPETFYETPNVNRLASEGMRFIQGYAACPVCSPTRASIMTGKYPARLNTTDYFGAPQPETVGTHWTRNKPLLQVKYEAKREKARGDTWGEEGDRKVRLVQNHAVYAGMVEAMDQAVGKILRFLQESGLEEKTVVFFMSDNGGLSTSEGHPTSNLPLRAGKGWLYEGGIRKGDYKLIEFFEENRLVELYNIAEDIGEQKNLADSLPDIRNRMLEMLHTWQAEVEARFPTPNPAY